MKAPLSYLLLFAVQFACAAVFLYDILANLLGLRAAPISWRFYEFIEIGAALGLTLGVGVTGWMLARAMQRQQRAERSLRLASGAFMAVLEERFDQWGLTPAERDVALFAVKGLSLADIAALRTTSEGTVKAQSNAIYRKAAVSGRAQLLSLFIDDLMGEALPGVLSDARPRETALSKTG